MTANNDSSDLEALFDSIASDYAPAPAAPVTPPPVAKQVASVGDNDDLQALFDSVSAEVSAANGSSETVQSAPQDALSKQETAFNTIGLMARQLHDTLRELGYDKLIEKTVSAIPDAKDRLAYVANLTEQAACRVLNATDIAGPLVDEIESSSRGLGERWDRVFANQMGVADFRQLAIETRTFLKEGLPARSQATHAQLTEIMMAQDFQDLTGQVIKKIVALTQSLETGLMSTLLQLVPDGRRTEEVDNLMNGPVISAEGRADVVVNQEQVDDLLDSLGF